MHRAVSQAAAEQTLRASSWTMGWCGHPEDPVALFITAGTASALLIFMMSDVSGAMKGSAASVPSPTAPVVVYLTHCDLAREQMWVCA